MRKEDWRIEFTSKRYMDTIYKFRNSPLRLFVKNTHPKKEIPEARMYFETGTLRMNSCSIADIMCGNLLKEEDKIALAYYVNIEYVEYEWRWRPEYANEFITMMHGGIKEWEDFIEKGDERSNP
jgi:hypothetical protein